MLDNALDKETYTKGKERSREVRDNIRSIFTILVVSSFRRYLASEKCHTLNE
jgi:hypothetical protein